MLDTPMRQVTNLTQAVQELQTQARTPMSAVAANLMPLPEDMAMAPEQRITMPENFPGDRLKYRSFIMSCELMLDLQPCTYHSDSIKVCTLISLLSGPSHEWAHELLRDNDPVVQHWDSFVTLMSSMYDDPNRRDTSQTAIRALRQGRRPVEEYIADFKRYSKDTR
ncbi:Hypothetical predicted protein [Pelobates cultripes]|uniref:Retrotransposon gag domain-containing protein n=1 Tax=Pelobates cultripes TaxID=61616 RepID=A0AAD1S7E4_PELCU|nr:Hypothetical predicted protein [Pelobates cultripes]